METVRELSWGEEDEFAEKPPLLDPAKPEDAELLEAAAKIGIDLNARPSGRVRRIKGGEA